MPNPLIHFSDPEARCLLSARAAARELEYLAGQIGEATFLRSLLNYGYSLPDARHELAKLSREIIVTEKIDGTNGVIYVGDDGGVVVGSRSQWITTRAKGGADNFGFASWAEQHADELRTLGPGRHYGEWWGSGIQRGYGLPKGEKRFSLFNVARWSDEMNEVLALARPACCHVVPILYRGMFVTDQIERVLDRLEMSGSVAAPGFMKPEGVVIFHPQGNVGFKKTIEKDEEWKSKL